MQYARILLLLVEHYTVKTNIIAIIYQQTQQHYNFVITKKIA